MQITLNSNYAFMPKLWDAFAMNLSTNIMPAAPFRNQNNRMAVYGDNLAYNPGV